MDQVTSLVVQSDAVAEREAEASESARLENTSEGSALAKMEKSEVASASAKDAQEAEAVTETPELGIEGSKVEKVKEGAKTEGGEVAEATESAQVVEEAKPVEEMKVAEAAKVEEVKGAELLAAEASKESDQPVVHAEVVKSEVAEAPKQSEEPVVHAAEVAEVRAEVVKPEVAEVVNSEVAAAESSKESEPPVVHTEVVKPEVAEVVNSEVASAESSKESEQPVVHAEVVKPEVAEVVNSEVASAESSKESEQPVVHAEVVKPEVAVAEAPKQSEHAEVVKPEVVFVLETKSSEEERREKAAIVFQSFWRRKRDRRLFEMQSKRARVAKELLDTEQTYVSSLEMMIRLYMKPLLASARTSDPIIPRAKVQAIFSVVEVMTNLNKVLLDDLKKRLDCWHVDQVLGDIFLAMGDYLKIATQFVNNYETAVSTISGELKTNTRFKVFYDEMRETPECKKNDLKAFLIMPVQRIPRYEMLLRELIRKTPSNHPDFAPLNDAYHKIQSISQLIDSRKDENVKFQEVLRVHGLLDPKVPNLIAPTRRFVAEASLMFLKRNASKAKPVLGQLFLFNDMLVICDRIEDEKKTLRGRQSSKSDLAASAAKYRPKEVLALMDFQSHLLKDHLSIQVAASKASENFEMVFMPPEGTDASVLVEFVKLLSKARLNLESNSSSSNISRNRPSVEEADAPTKRTPSDPLSSSSTKVDQLSMVARRTPSDSSRASGGGGGGVAESDLATPPDTEDSIEHKDALADQAKQNTIDALNKLIAETEVKSAALVATAETETNEEEKKKLLAEAKVLEGKVATMRAALQEQVSGVGTIAKQNSLSRSRSNTGDLVVPPKRGFSLRGASKDASPSPTPPTPKKGLFSTVRKKKLSSEEKE